MSHQQALEARLQQISNDQFAFTPEGYAGLHGQQVPINQCKDTVSQCKESSTTTSRTLSEEVGEDPQYVARPASSSHSADSAGLEDRGLISVAHKRTGSTRRDAEISTRHTRVLPQLAPRGATSRAVFRPKDDQDIFIHSNYPASGAQNQAPRTKRKIEDDNERQGYIRTRAAGACAWCARRKVRCHWLHCPACRVHGIDEKLCCRTAMKDLLTFDQVGLARRFVDKYINSVKRWCGDGIKLQIGHGLGKSISITVHRYEPKEKIVDLFWIDPKGWQKIEHQPFGLKETGDLGQRNLDKYVSGQVPLLIEQLRRRAEDAKSKHFVSMMHLVQTYIAEGPEKPLKWTLQVCLQLWGYVYLQYHGLWRAVGEDDKSDRLGMKQLVRNASDVGTITNIDGVIPLPRFLHQQIHACVEARMTGLNTLFMKKFTEELASFKLAGNNPIPGTESDALGLYLGTWIYLSILEEVQWDADRWKEFLDVFNWPLDKTPSQTAEMCDHFAYTIVAHYNSAMNNTSLRKLIAEHNKAFQDGVPFLDEEVIKPIQTTGPPLVNCRNATFDRKDIRSLELKYSSLIACSSE